MSVRLKDIARVTGVSVKTVSNVVNGYAHVKEHTRMRVKKALDEMGYQPNLSARYLRKARVGVIALAIPDVSIPYFSEVGDAIITEAKARNYTVLLEHTGGRYEDEIQLLHGLRPHFIDGLILSPFALQYEDFLQRTNDIPLVLLGERSYEGANFDHVVIDNVEATKRMMRHLIACGKRRIAAIGAQVSGVGAIGASEETGRFRLHGYTEALIEAGYEVDPSLIVSVGAYHRADGADAMRRVLASGAQPDAVFCFNDVLALGAIRALHEQGVRIPEDIAVAGFDDIEDGRFATPSLTTISPDKKRIAEIAVSLLWKQIERRHGASFDDTAQDETAKQTAPYQLIARESTLGVTLRSAHSESAEPNPSGRDSLPV